MVFKRYHFQILLRLMLIIANCFVILYLWQLKQYWISFYNLAFLLVLQAYLLFRFLTRWQHDIAIFANSVRHGDYNITYNLTEKDEVHYDLYKMLNSISAYVREVKSSSVQQNQYFQYLVENAQVGMLAYDQHGSVLLINDEALRLIGTNRLQTLHHLKDFAPELYEQIIEMPFHQPRLLHTGALNKMKLSARLSEIVIDGKAIRFLSLINIKSELDENELQSWQDLISVLTHELMNSITPINSLAGSMGKYLSRIEGNEEVLTKAKHSLDVIARRSDLLMNFVDRYRKISAVPLPRLQYTDIGKVIADVLLLLEGQTSDIVVNYSYREVMIYIDPSMMEQVFINLIKNSVVAMYDVAHKRLDIDVRESDREIQIVIADAGRGIPPQVLDKIFIPFFTTREGGSGIGLTISRQIMHRHGGTIEIRSSVDKGTSCILTIPKPSR